jgi:hypothetical protein
MTTPRKNEQRRPRPKQLRGTTLSLPFPEDAPATMTDPDYKLVGQIVALSKLARYFCIPQPLHLGYALVRGAVAGAEVASKGGVRRLPPGHDRVRFVTIEGVRRLREALWAAWTARALQASDF